MQTAPHLEGRYCAMRVISADSSEEERQFRDFQLTVDDPHHPPQSEEDDQRGSFKRFFFFPDSEIACAHVHPMHQHYTLQYQYMHGYSFPLAYQAWGAHKTKINNILPGVHTLCEAFEAALLRGAYQLS